jgi:hypothetical protein
MVLYVCLLHSRCIENHLIDHEATDPSFLGGSTTAGIRARSRLNTHSKHLKITTIFTVRNA